MSPLSGPDPETEITCGRHDLQEGMEETDLDYFVKAATLVQMLQAGAHLQFHVQTPVTGKMGGYASEDKCNAGFF